MRSYRYRCDPCGLESAPLMTPEDMEYVRQVHIDAHHGGRDPEQPAEEPHRQQADLRQLAIGAGVVLALAALGWARKHL